MIDSPSLVEWKVTAGIWAFGMLLLTVLLKLIATVFTAEKIAGSALPASD